MAVIPQRVFDSIPPRWSVPLTIGAGIMAAGATLGVLAAVVWGSWGAALAAVIGFGAGGILWHLADHASH
ncbi:MAG TPA: hypothetical protein VFY15_07050 [Acidimicrobiia bacterium]|nr:hypothetical protein [Acidimicrobiia bacterium]